MEAIFAAVTAESAAAKRRQVLEVLPLPVLAEQLRIFGKVCIKQRAQRANNKEAREK